MQNTEHFDWSYPICTDISNLRSTRVEFAEESTGSGGLYKELKAKIDYKGLKIAHLNVRGILNKIGEIRLLLLDSKLDVLAITETHLKGDINSSEISVDGYKIARCDRMHKSCGGCMIYYSNNLSCYERADLLTDIEAVWINITCDSQQLIIGCIYRPPDDSQFYEIFYSTLERIWMKRKNILLMGDFNADLLPERDPELKSEGRRLLRVLSSFDLYNVIAQPTRITSSSSTLLDLVITSNTSKIVNSGVFDPGLSDHCLVFAVVKFKRDKAPPKIITTRNYKHVDIQPFQRDMEKTPWSVLNIFDDIDDVEYAFNTLYNNIIKALIPERKVKIRSNSLPWITSAIRKCMN